MNNKLIRITKGDGFTIEVYRAGTRGAQHRAYELKEAGIQVGDVKFGREKAEDGSTLLTERLVAWYERPAAIKAAEQK